MHPTIYDTLETVKTAHATTNATDKGGNTPYYWHLLRVMLRIKNPTEDQLHIALLHDVIEDTHITLEHLEQLGYNQNIIDSVKWCSRNMFPDLTFTEWMIKIGKEAPEDAIIVKIADISDNLGFERMNGLMNKGSGGKLITKKKSKHQYPMQQRIDKKVSKKMRLHGEMGVFDRYYKGWNNIFETQTNLPLIDKVELSDFSTLSQIKQLMQWLPHDEQLKYMSNNKLHTWEIEGNVAVINDRAGQPYLALHINETTGQLYQAFLSSHINQEYIENQQKRDHNSFHVTLINAMNYSKLIKDENHATSINNIVGKNFKLFAYGIGSAIEENKDKQAWFVVLENMELQQWRQKFTLPNQDFHITLGFKNGDVFTQRKNQTSKIFDNKTIWNYWINNSFTIKNTKKLRL